MKQPLMPKAALKTWAKAKFVAMVDARLQTLRAESSAAKPEKQQPRQSIHYRIL